MTAGYCSGQHQQLNDTMMFAAARAPLVSDFKCTAVDHPQECASDCRTLLTCAGVDGPSVTARTCVSINPRKPYCVQGICTATPDIDDPNCQPAMICTSAGLFPDPSDCHMYHSCTAAGAESKLHRCNDDDTVFNPRLGACTSRWTTICNRVECPRTPLEGMVVIRGSPAYFAYCTQGRTAEIYMYKCRDPENEIFDMTLNRCRYNCRSLGTFVDRTDCTRYVTCSFSRGRWTATKITCPIGYHFDGNACVVDKVNKCKAELLQ